MKRVISILCAAALLFGAAAFAEEDSSKQEQYDLGMEQIASGEYEEAYQTFSNLGHYSDAFDKAYLLSSQKKATLEALNDHAATMYCVDTVTGSTVYGLINFSTNKIIAPCWSEIKIYTDDRLAVKNALEVAGNNKWGICDDNGEMLHTYLWSNVSEDAVDGIFVTMNYTGDQQRFGLATTDGKVLAYCRWTCLGDLDGTSETLRMPSFPCGLIRVCDAYGNWGFVDSGANVRIRLHYAGASDFSEEDGLAQVTVRKGRKQYISYINVNDEETYFEKGQKTVMRDEAEEAQEKLSL